MSEIGINSFFCEDVRTEVGNKPMFLGVYSSTVVVEQLPDTDDLIHVSMFYVPPDVEFFDASLRLLTIYRDVEIVLFESTKTFTRQGPANVAWTSVNNFRLSDFEMREGLVLVAEVTAAGCRQVRQLRFEAHEEAGFDILVEDAETSAAKQNA
jgi:hypothetical protein